MKLRSTIIAIGNLNGVRKKNKGRKVNRKVNSMLSLWLNANKKTFQGLFVCKDCGYKINADVKN